MSDVILLEDVNLLSVFKENRTKWLRIMLMKSCRAPPVGIIFTPIFFAQLFGLSVPTFSVLFAGKPVEALLVWLITCIGYGINMVNNIYIGYRTNIVSNRCRTPDEGI